MLNLFFGNNSFYIHKTTNAMASAVLSELSDLTVIRLEAMVFIPLPLYLIAKILKY